MAAGMYEFKQRLEAILREDVPLMPSDMLRDFVAGYFARRDAYLAAAIRHGSPLYLQELEVVRTQADAFKKAGAVDREKFIDALEGLAIQSPVGEIEMRACDHQAVLPIFLGVTRKSPEYEFIIAGDIVTLSGDEVMPTCQEIAAERQK